MYFHEGKGQPLETACPQAMETARPRHWRRHAPGTGDGTPPALETARPRAVEWNRRSILRLRHEGVPAP